MKKIERFECEKCHTQWKSARLANICENSPMPPCRAKVGDEVRLRNRNCGFTLAVVKEIYIVSCYLAPFENLSEEELEAKGILQGLGRSQFHEWKLSLDRDVDLDHKWESATSLVGDFYVLSDDEVNGIPEKGREFMIRSGEKLTRQDNCSW